MTQKLISKRVRKKESRTEVCQWGWQLNWLRFLWTKKNTKKTQKQMNKNTINNESNASFLWCVLMLFFLFWSHSQWPNLVHTPTNIYQSKTNFVNCVDTTRTSWMQVFKFCCCFLLRLLLPRYRVFWNLLFIRENFHLKVSNCLKLKHCTQLCQNFQNVSVLWVLVLKQKNTQHPQR